MAATAAWLSATGAQPAKEPLAQVRALLADAGHGAAGSSSPGSTAQAIRRS